MDNTYHIREAHSEDIDAILELILSLATYEKAREKVKATPELLQKNLFENKYASTLLAFSGHAGSPDDKPIGMALYFFNFSTWTGRPGLFLEDLYVVPEYRGQGIGKALFGHLGRIAKERECGRLDWQVLDWNQPSIDFYEKVLGATMMKEWKGMRLEGDGLDALQKFIPTTS
ncbi:hypothetical protein BS47DRAFT_1329323 [Hydnum rufescens UP504]|uniref:N-acetyltransferase domain-containing protein n=1 Tax=Hydnum rufescens UP504 TaxID=1448309 RepID=A0A9P6DXE4_9AGAM|nr:hypothetical protein BS47DRAFT_1329323 [Hydnum rufescens UP504]